MKQSRILKTPNVNPIFSFLGCTDNFVVFNVVKANFRKTASNPIYMASMFEVMNKLKLDEIYMPNIAQGVSIESADDECMSDRFRFDGKSIMVSKNPADALISKKRKFLAIAPADCMVAGVIDVKTDIISIVHLGWRGALGDILLKTIDEMLLREKSKKENIRIFIGPSIKKENFEIKIDVKSLIDNYCIKHKFSFEKYVTVKDDESWLFDQDSLVRDAILDYGIEEENFFISDMDTFSSLDKNGNYLYHSYRRDHEDAGRILVGIVPTEYYNNVISSCR